jgi:predicted TPR repeat methyltransferase
MKRAQALTNAKDYAAAEALYNKAITLDSKDTIGLLLRGFLRDESGNLDGAIADDTSKQISRSFAEVNKAQRAKNKARCDSLGSWSDINAPKRTDDQILADFYSDSKANVLDEEDYIFRGVLYETIADDPKEARKAAGGG